MSQKLCLPINDMMMTAAYKNDKYRAQFGYGHYGVMTSVPSTTAPVTNEGKISVGDKVKVKSGAKSYNGGGFAALSTTISIW